MSLRACELQCDFETRSMLEAGDLVDLSGLLHHPLPTPNRCGSDVEY